MSGVVASSVWMPVSYRIFRRKSRITESDLERRNDFPALCILRFVCYNIAERIVSCAYRRLTFQFAAPPDGSIKPIFVLRDARYKETIMSDFTLSVPCLFGLEGLCARELRRLGMKDVAAENGRVLFQGDFQDVIRANLWLRTGERVLLRVAAFPARTFEELFQGAYHAPLEEFIPRDGAFPVKGHCLNSRLHSVPDCQAVIKKAAAKRLGERYHLGWMPESGSLYQLQFSIMKDQAELFLDTTGAGLHKRGYRAVGNDAPLRETLAAAMVTLSRYRGRDNFVDPFCGSGTIAIEAAMIAKNRAPGLNRTFACQEWAVSRETDWQAQRSAAMEQEYHGDYHIFASDIDEKSLGIARSNAKKAGMERWISFSRADAVKLTLPEGKGVIVTNPPYGQRMLEQQQARQLLREFGRHVGRNRDYAKYIISSEEELERYFGKKCTKKRKLYNGMIKCNLFMYENQRDRVME